MKFGTFLFHHRGPFLAAAARCAEDLGYESVWMGEHLWCAGRTQIDLLVRTERPRPPVN